MTLIGLVVVLIVVGVLLYLLNALLPIDGKIKMIINCLVVVVVLLWALQAVGLLNTGPRIRLTEQAHISCLADA